MPIDEQKVILNLKNNTDNKLITAKDIPGINRIGLLPDGTTYFEYEPVTIYGKQPDMIDNTIGIPTRGIRDKALSTLGLATAGVMSLPLITYAGETAAASAAPSIITNIGRFGWKVLNHPITQTIGTIDGFRNLFTGNGVQKTYNHFKNEEYGRGILSLAGDILNASPLIGAGRSIPHIYRLAKNSSVEKLNNFDDAIDSAISYWKRNIDPNIQRTDYFFKEHPIPGGYSGYYKPRSTTIHIAPNNPYIQRNAVIHEMRHFDDYDLNIKPDWDNSFILGPELQNGVDYGRLKLGPRDHDLLNFTYRPLPVEERIAVNADFRETLDRFAQKEMGRILSKPELDAYIQDLPWPVLSLGRAMSGYPNKKSGAILLSPDHVKSTLINVK